MKSNLNRVRRCAFLAACAASLITLAACTATVSHVTPEGTTAQPVFPDVSQVNFNHRQGIFPDRGNVAMIRAGMTKDQLYHLLGRPHFREGMFGVREWDYVFHFRTPGSGIDGVTTCQYKVLFDRKALARSFFWKAVAPADAVCPSDSAKRTTVSADHLFGLNSADLNRIDPAGGRRPIPTPCAVLELSPQTTGCLPGAQSPG